MENKIGACKGRCHRLAWFDVALQHHPIDRREMRALTRLVSLIRIRLGNADIGLGAFNGRTGPIIGRLGGARSC